jgi:hypothetical protein
MIVSLDAPSAFPSTSLGAAADHLKGVKKSRASSQQFPMKRPYPLRKIECTAGSLKYPTEWLDPIFPSMYYNQQLIVL